MGQESTPSLHHWLYCTPYEKLTGREPDLSLLCTFGSHVFLKDQGKRKAKLDYHYVAGVFLGFTATTKNCYYIDDHTAGLVKIGTHTYFDEAHMTTRANRAPLTAEALQRLGYNAREHWITDDIVNTSDSTISNTIQVQKLTPTATMMSRTTDGSVGYDLFSDSTDAIHILPGAIATIPSGLAAAAPTGSYLRIAPRSGLTVKNHLHTLAGVVDPDY